MSDYYLADDFLALRKASVMGYKKLCNAILKIKNPRELLRAGLCILQTEPNDRQDFEVQILQKATEDLQFFRDLNDERIHYQCCKMMRYRSYEKNQIVFRQGETSTEFFIIIEGTVNVYVAKPQEEIAQLIHADKLMMKGMLPEEKMRHHSQIIENYQIQLNRPQFAKQLTICLNDDGIQAIRKVVNMRSSIKMEEQPEEETEEQIIVKKVTNGIDSFEDKAFFFKNGIFLHTYITTIGEGAIFGERGLMIESKRTGTVVASSNLQVVYLTKQDYKVILETNQLDKIRKKIRLLCNHFLSQTTYKEAIQCQYLFEKIKYPMGSNVYRDNSSDQNIYIIKKGTVKVLRTISKQQLPLCELGTEQYFGDVEYFENCKRYHTILVTSRKLSLYKISFIDLQKLFSICSGVEPMLLKNYEQRKLIDIERVNQQSKLSKLVENQKKLSLKHLNRHDKLLPSTMLEEIHKKNEQLQSLRKLQRIKNKSQPQTLASVLVSLEKQTRLFKREERKQEILRFSQFEKKMSRCNSVANQEPQTQLTSPTNSIISSKHNLFRQKPTKIFLMSHYEHKIPRTLSQDIISSLQFESPSKTQFR